MCTSESWSGNICFLRLNHKQEIRVRPLWRSGYVQHRTADQGRQPHIGSETILRPSKNQLLCFFCNYQYAFEDFGIRQVALLLGKSADVATYTNRSLVSPFFSVGTGTRAYDFFSHIATSGIQPSAVTDSKASLGFFTPKMIILKGVVSLGFFQKRMANGTFVYTDPTDCSPQDTDTSRECSLQGDNTSGFYESSAWEYSWYGLILNRRTRCLETTVNRYAPHDTAHLVQLMGGNVSIFERRKRH